MNTRKKQIDKEAPPKSVPQIKIYVIHAVLYLVNRYRFESLTMNQIVVSSKVKRSQLFAVFKNITVIKEECLKFSLNAFVGYLEREGSTKRVTTWTPQQVWSLIFMFSYYYRREVQLLTIYLANPLVLPGYEFKQEMSAQLSGVFQVFGQWLSIGGNKSFLLICFMLQRALHLKKSGADITNSYSDIPGNSLLFDEHVMSYIRRLQELPFD
ncbi:hypothetical protein IM792_11970 [Mucilaginibacter sp. JRF]|uniref:hypothetical protein n=1 Tax=Mucilaginibacter sp. JRF TaxID=2780088 RepID=UPI001882E08F|nr:hypothetical protein [Mucilaginibacter sp. JRF]MBE9585168.1 hypothetical protein [Mucilaginibacter sp. JRF]